MNKTVHMIEAEYLSLMAGKVDGNSIAAFTFRLNRSHGNLTPTTLRLSRSQLERIVEDATHLLSTSPSLNTDIVLAKAVQRTDVSTLPALDDPPHDFDSPLDGDSKNT